MDFSPHRFRLKGRDAEVVLHQLAFRSFFTDWCYPNPSLPNGKELCDLLVVFDSIAIIWQVKNLKIHPDGRYKRKEVRKNIRQLAGARRQLLELSRPIALSNPRRETELFGPEKITRTYLISVLAGEGEEIYSPAEALKQGTVHIFPVQFVETILNELDTIADFVNYLSEKHTLLERLDRVVIMGGEEELLASYLINGRSFEYLKGAKGLLLDRGIWTEFRDSAEFRAKKKADQISYGWDQLIDCVHQGGRPEYERIARELASSSRFERRFLSTVFYDAFKTANQAREHEIFRRVLPRYGCTYCFLFADDQDPRNHRKNMLKALCYVARGDYRENTKVIGIATGKKIRPENTYDFCMLEQDSWTDDDRKRVEEIRRKTGLLTNLTFSETRIEEYPGV